VRIVLDKKMPCGNLLQRRFHGIIDIARPSLIGPGGGFSRPRRMPSRGRLSSFLGANNDLTEFHFKSRCHCKRILRPPTMILANRFF